MVTTASSPPPGPAGWKTCPCGRRFGPRHDPSWPGLLTKSDPQGRGLDAHRGFESESESMSPAARPGEGSEAGGKLGPGSSTDFRQNRRTDSRSVREEPCAEARQGPHPAHEAGSAAKRLVAAIRPVSRLQAKNHPITSVHAENDEAKRSFTTGALGTLAGRGRLPVRPPPPPPTQPRAWVRNWQWEGAAAGSNPS